MPRDPQLRPRHPWTIAAAVLAATFVLVLISFVDPHEWADSVVFTAAHIAVHRIIVSGHRRE